MNKSDDAIEKSLAEAKPNVAQIEELKRIEARLQLTDKIINNMKTDISMSQNNFADLDAEMIKQDDHNKI